MAATYTAGGTAARDDVRLLIGDTPPGGLSEFPADVDALYQDAELDRFLTLEGDVVNLAAALALETLARNSAGEFDFTADGATFKKGTKAASYAAQARLLRARGRGHAVLYPLRKDGYSDDVSSEEAVAGGGAKDWDRGRWDEF